MSTAPKDDGGPAFPNEPRQIQSGDTRHVWDGLPGMSLRDYFAGKALEGQLSNPEFFSVTGSAADKMKLPFTGAVALASYEYSDAMLKARQGVMP